MHELGTHQFQAVMPVFDEYLPDPMLYAVLEGRRSGRVYADDALHPNRAFVWTDSESAYVASSGGAEAEQSDAEFLAAFRRLILEEIIPQAREVGLGFLSLFSFPEACSLKLEQLFAGQLALRTPINTFAFDEALFRQRHSTPVPLVEGFVLRRIDLEVLEQPACKDLSSEIAFHWGSVAAFCEEGIGYCVLHGGDLVSWCYVQAIGLNAQTIDIWTHPDRRGEGLGTAVGAAVIHHGLGQGLAPFWFCDDGNWPSRRLAECLAFHYTGDLYLVDIPFEPYSFYRDLAVHFYLPAGKARQAAEAYERAFTVQEGTRDDHANAALAWAKANEPERAMHHLRKAGLEAWPS